MSNVGFIGLGIMGRRWRSISLLTVTNCLCMTSVDCRNQKGELLD
jgi:hypothetical protein